MPWPGRKPGSPSRPRGPEALSSRDPRAARWPTSPIARHDAKRASGTSSSPRNAEAAGCDVILIGGASRQSCWAVMSVPRTAPRIPRSALAPQRDCATRPRWHGMDRSPLRAALRATV